MKNLFLPLPLRALAATAAGALLTVSALAQAPAPGAPATPAPAAATPAPKPLSVTEKNFIKNVGNSLYYMVQVASAGKTAVTDEKLTRMRDTSITSLNKSYEGLNKIAKERGEPLKGELTGSDKTSVERMGKLKEDKFVKEWVEELAKEGKKLGRDFEAGERTVQDPELKMYVVNYSPLVRSVVGAVEGAEKAAKEPKKKK